MIAPNLQGISTYYHVVRQIIEDTGKRQMAVSGPDGTRSKIVKLHAKFQMLILNWSAEREGAPPIMPSTNIGDENFVFLNGTISGVLQSPNQALRPVYSQAGTYFYAVVTPFKMDGNFALGKLPWDNVQKDDVVIPDSYFSSDFIARQPTSDYFIISGGG